MIQRAAVENERGAWAFAIVIAILASSLPALAQEPSGAERQAASEAYDRATAAYLAHDYARAAPLFETAYRLAPNAAALIQAVRSYDRAGDHLRAGTLALRLAARHAGDAQADRQAATTLRTATHDYLRVDVTCDATCTVEVDGHIEDASFFVDPASAHAVRASFDTGDTAPQSTSGAAGETQALSFARPPAPIEPPTQVAIVDDGEDRTTIPPVDQPPPASGGGLSPAFFVTAGVLTVAAGAVLIWSGIDTLDGVPAYRDDPTTARLQDGQARELRTNVLIGVTGALALTTLVFAIVTDWDGDPAPSETPAVSAAFTGDSGLVSVEGRF